MAKVYLVWSGCYSDRDVAAAFTTLEAANALVASFKPNEYESLRVEERELDVPAFTRGAGLRAYTVEIDYRTGDVKGVTESTKPDESFESHIEYCDWTTGVFATDADHAVKIARERFFAWRASHQAATYADDEADMNLVEPLPF
jgi:hypothetical protein